VNGKETENDPAFPEQPCRLFRTGLNRDHRVVWDLDPIIAQAETIAHGRILTMKQVWRADGYSLGDLLYSLPLAPLQKNIAIIDWSRSDSFRRDESQTNVDALSNTFGRERDISEIANWRYTRACAAVRRPAAGRLALAGVFFPVLGFGSASGGSSGSSSESSQDSTKTLAASFLNSLRDKTQQSANSYRAQHVTVVQQIDQSERQKIVTETVANRNASCAHDPVLRCCGTTRSISNWPPFASAFTSPFRWIALYSESQQVAFLDRKGLINSVHLAGIRALERIEQGYPYLNGQFADGTWICWAARFLLLKIGLPLKLVRQSRAPPGVTLPWLRRISAVPANCSRWSRKSGMTISKPPAPRSSQGRLSRVCISMLTLPEPVTI
jgi:hypothetical protein